MKEIILGGGCFWCIEAVFQRLKGVEQAISGYAGGHIKNPAYREVCNGTTGHAEVVKIVYDENVISLKQLLEVFFTSHDPTTLNRQGNDVGTQYRSAIYYSDPGERELIDQVVEQFASDIWPDPIVTEIGPLDHFYSAEEYHQNYYNEHSEQGYCSIVINPKVAKLKKNFAALLKPGA